MTVSLHTRMDGMGPAGLSFSPRIAAVPSGCRSPTWSEAVG